jgi:predicted permease
MTHVLSDLRYACRGLRKAPIFTTVAVLSIALGIGANAAVFTLVDRVLIRLLPVAHPEQLVVVTAEGAQYGNGWGDGNELSYPRYADLRDHNDVFTGMLCRFGYPLHVGFEQRTERVQGELVSGTYFPVLGVGAYLGRTFNPDEDKVPNGHLVAMLSHAYWKTRFGSDPAVVGKTLIVNGQTMTIVGVAHEGFDGINKGTAAQVFVPIMMAGRLTPLTDGITDRRTRWLNVFARLRPGVTPAQASAALQPFYAAQLRMEVTEAAFARASATDKGNFVKGTVAVTPAGHGRSDLRRQLTTPLWVLMAIVTCVLLIACANVANLLLARASARQREVAIRLAVGATPRRILQQVLIESVLLALLGGVAGLAIATWGADLLLGFFRDPDAVLTVSASPDSRVLGFVLLVSLATGLMFGVMPASQSLRAALATTLKNEAGAVVGGSSVRLRKALVIAQVALSLLLLIGAALFIRSLRNLMAIDPGFDTTHLISFSVDPKMNGYEGVRGKQFAKALLEQIQRMPEVTGAGFGSASLLEGGSWNSGMTIEGGSVKPGDRVVTHNNLISPGYFKALGMKIVAGRDFDTRDEIMAPVTLLAANPTTVIVNQTFVKRYLGERYPLGVHIGFGRDPGTPTPIEIVGVVSDAKYRSLRNETEPQAFFAYFAGPDVGFTMYVRTMAAPEGMFASLRRAVQEMDPNLPLFAMQTFETRVQRSVSNERLIASLSSVFGVLATLLAMIGLYGVMAYTVTQRTREIGIRMALGAASWDVARMILRDVTVLVGTGLAIALPAAWALGRYVENQLFGIAPTDPATVAAAVAALVTVAALAGVIPARRAARINPIRALRYD